MVNKHAKSADSKSAKRCILNDEPQKTKGALKGRFDIGSEKLSTFRSKSKRKLTSSLVRVYAGELNSWDEYNTTLLKTLFSDPQIATDYRSIYGIAIKTHPTLQESAHEVDSFWILKLRRLDSLIKQMPLFDKASSSTTVMQVETKSLVNEVFIVHGHDEAIKQSTARFLEHLDIKPVILGEKAGRGRAIIEKLEQESNVGYAIVLLTPDDEGKLKKNTKLKPRARQNVIMELGYFIGKFGRSRVCAITAGSVEIPTDYHGVEYIPFDDAGGWKLKLVNELEAAKLKVDRTKLR